MIEAYFLLKEEEEEFAEVNEEGPELAGVKEEFAEQNAEGGSQAQPGAQGQLGFQVPAASFVNPGMGFPTLQAFPVSISFMYMAHFSINVIYV